MADTKLPALPQVTSLSALDKIYAVDVSDTTDDPTGSSVGINVGDLLAGAGVKTVVTKTLIGEFTDPTSGEFDFDNIPAGYDRLVIEGKVRGDKAADNDNVLMFFNSDTTTANYHFQYLAAYNGTALVSEAAEARIGNISAASAPTDSYTSFRIAIEDYAGSTLKSANNVFTQLRLAGEIFGGTYDMSHTSMTAAITRVRIRSLNHPTDKIIGTLRIYGEKEETLGANDLSNMAGTTITAKIPVETITNTTGGEFDFSNIPQDGDRLIIEGKVRGDATGTVEVLYAFLNNDLTNANYHATLHYADEGTAVAVESANPHGGYCGAASSPTDSYTSWRLTIEDYTGSTLKVTRSQFDNYQANDDLQTGHTGIVSAITNPVDRIRLRTDGHATDGLLGELTLYKEKQIVIPSLEEMTKTITTKTLLETIDRSVAGEFDFNNIPAGYDRLIIQGEVRSDVAGAGGDVVLAYINSDTTDTNYHRQNNYVDNGVANIVEGTAPRAAVVPSAGSPAGAMGSLEIVIEDYAGSNLKGGIGRFKSLYDTEKIVEGEVAFTHETQTTAISRVQIRTDNHATDQLTGTLRIYGEKEEAIPGVSGADSSGTTVTTLVPVETIVNTVAGNFDFQNIPQDGERLIIKGRMRGDAAITGTSLLCWLNNDTTAANYYVQQNHAFNGVGYVSEQTASTSVAVVSAASSPADIYTSFELRIEGYTTGDRKHMQGRYWGARDNAQGETGDRMTIHDTLTNAVDQVTLEASSGNLLGELTLYVEKEITLPTTQTEQQTITVKDKLGEIENTAAGNFDFANLPSGYDRFVIEGEVRGDSVAAASDQLRVFINGDTTDSNYHSTCVRTINGGANNNEELTAAAGHIPAAGTGSVSDSYSQIKLTFENCAGSNLKSIKVENTAYTEVDKHIVFFGSITSAITAAITQIQVQTDNDPTDQLLGKLTVYGEKEEAVGTGGAAEHITLPVVQSAYFDSTGTVLWSSEPGWSGSNVSTGINDITFPTAAPGANDQSINVTCNSSVTGTSPTVGIHTITTTGCRVELKNAASGSALGRNFFVTRRLDGVVAKAAVVTGGKVELETIELTTAGEFDFNNIPSGFKRLVVQGSVRGDVASTTEVLYAFLNTDTTVANYHRQQNTAANGAANVGEAADARIGIAPGDSSPASSEASVRITIENYDQGQLKMMAGEYHAYTAADELNAGICSVVSAITAPVTRLRIRTDNQES
jgi:carbon monoxide dehydrogenase subunit G